MKSRTAGNERRRSNTATATALFEAAEGGDQDQGKLENVSLAGRITSMRTMGKAAFLDLQDASGSIQALLRQNNLEDGFDLLKNLDIGDHLGVRGNLIRTRTGQVTIDALELTVTAKGMRPLPEKYHGLRDVETRYRQRYLDLIANQEEVMPVFVLRSKVIRGIRRCLDDRGFLEVDTPILNNRPLVPDAEARSTMMLPEDIAEGILLAATLPARTMIDDITFTPTIQRDTTKDIAAARMAGAPEGAV